MEREYVYEVGLTPDDKRNIQLMLGVRTLGLDDYRNAREVIGEIDPLAPEEEEFQDE